MKKIIDLQVTDVISGVYNVTHYTIKIEYSGWWRKTVTKELKCFWNKFFHYEESTGKHPFHFMFDSNFLEAVQTSLDKEISKRIS
jgi:hypothetical protein